jgi:threonine dehydratase
MESVSSAGKGPISDGDPTRVRPWVIGVEPSLGDDAARSFRSGERVHLDQVPATIADGLRTRYLGARNFAVIRERVRDIVTVEEESIRQAVARLWLFGKQLVEPSGAVPLAGILEEKIDVRGLRIGIVISGGNCDVSEVGAWVRERAASLDRG